MSQLNNAALYLGKVIELRGYLHKDGAVLVNTNNASSNNATAASVTLKNTTDYHNVVVARIIPANAANVGITVNTANVGTIHTTQTGDSTTISLLSHQLSEPF